MIVCDVYGISQYFVDAVVMLMKSSRLFLLFAVVAVLFIYGCTIKEPKNLGCCKEDEAKDNNQCVLVKQDAADETADTDNCDVTSGFCNITVTQGSETAIVEVPICSKAEEISCIQPACKSMICGPYRFRPSIGSPSLADMQAGGDEDGPSSYDAGPEGVWNMSCGFEYMDDKLQNVFKNTKGAFMNTFRLGVGPSFAEYDVAKFSFPLSDAACNANPGGSVDRYMNYLVTPDYYADNLAPSAYNSKYSQYKNQPKTPYPFDPIEDIGKEVCVQDNPTREPLNTLPYGGKSGSYLLEKQDAKVNFQLANPPLFGGNFDFGESPKTLNSYFEIPTEFYSNALRFMYWEDIKNQKKAPYECESGADCLSGNCNKGEDAPYTRGVCKKVTGTIDEFANCECKEIPYDDSYKEKVSRCDTVTKWTKPADAPDKPTFDYFMDDQEYKNKKLNFTVCKFFETDIYGDATPKTTYSECETTSGTSSLAKLKPTIVFPGKDHYSKIIDFEDAIGYSNLNKDQFKKSALVTECNMQEGKDYVVIDDVPTWWNSNNNLAGGFYYKNVKSDIIQQGSGSVIGYNTHLYTFTDDYIFIVDKDNDGKIGTCKLTDDPIEKAPLSTSFGWCEPCTYATMAMQKVTETDKGDLGNDDWYFDTKYLPDDEYDYWGNPLDLEESKGFKDSSLTCAYDKKSSSWWASWTWADCESEALPSLKPSVTYLQKTSARMLKQGVLPVFDVSADSLWNDLKFSYSSANNNFDFTWSTTKWILFSQVETPHLMNIRYIFENNKGPMVAVVSKVSKNDFSNSFIAPVKRFDIAARAAAVKELCPKCLTAVYIDNWDSSGSGAAIIFNSFDSQRVADKKTLGELFDFDYSTESCNDAGTSCNSMLLKYVDVISYRFDAAETVGSKFCENPSALSFSSFSPTLTELANLSRTTLQLIGKPSLVQQFTFRQFCNYLGPGSVVSKKTEQDITARMLSYLFVNQVELTKAGLIGLIYNEEDFKFNPDAEPTSTISGDAGTSFSKYQSMGVADVSDLPNTCALEKSVHYLSESKPAYMIQKIYTLPQEMANCMEKSPLEKNNPAVSTKCRNGEKCSLPNPMPFGKSESDYKCPTEVIPEPCKKCADKSGDFKCTFTYMDSSKKTIQGNTIPGQWGGLDSSYSDIIAGLGDAGEVCCLEDDSGANYTYIAKELSSSSKSPVVYSSIGDPEEDCGLANPSLLNTLCGVPNVPGIKDYKTECEVK